MAFNSSNPFGYSGGFEQGREYASPFGASHPEVLGLGALGEAAQAQSQFPVIAGGGGGSPIPSLSQVEEVGGGPSQIGNQTRDDTQGLLGGVARQTRIADEPTSANPAQLAGLAAGAAQKGGAFARDFANLGAFSGGGSLPDFSAGSPGSQVSGGELGLDAPGGGDVMGGDWSGVGAAAGSGGAALSSLLNILAAATGNRDLGNAGRAGNIAFGGFGDPYSGALAGLGGGLGLWQGIEEGDPLQAGLGLGSLYSGLAPVANTVFGTAFPTLSSAAGQLLASLSPEFAASLGIGAGAGAGAGAATGAAAGGAAAGAAGAEAGATAASAGAAAPLAMLTGPYVVAKLIQAIQALGPDKANARQLGNRVKNIYGQLPGEISQLQGIPGITGQLTANSTPEQAADILKQLNSIQAGYQAGGWESYQKSGQTGVESVGVGNMHAKLPDVQTALDQMNPYMQLMDVNRIRAQDVLGKAGWTPEQIQAQTGHYASPQEWAMGLNAQTYTGGSGQNPVYQDFNPTFNSQFRPQTQEGLMSSAGIENLSQLHDLVAAMQSPGSGLAAVNGYDPQMIASARSGSTLRDTPFGQVDPGMWDALSQIQPGNFEQGLGQYLQQYGGVNPGMVRMGFGQGWPAPGQQPTTGAPPMTAAQLQLLLRQAAPDTPGRAMVIA